MRGQHPSAAPACMARQQGGRKGPQSSRKGTRHRQKAPEAGPPDATSPGAPSPIPIALPLSSTVLVTVQSADARPTREEMLMLQQKVTTLGQVP